MVAKTIIITSEQAGGKTVSLPEYAGADLLLLRGGNPLNDNEYEVLSGGGFQLLGATDYLILNERFAVIPSRNTTGAVTGTYSSTQYPHIISITTKSGSYQNANGNWVPATETTVEKAGRYEPNSTNGMITAADGTRINYDGIVYLPLPQTALAPGAKVVVIKGAAVLLKGTIKRFSEGQLNARIWL